MNAEFSNTVPPQDVVVAAGRLLTPTEVAQRLQVSIDWVTAHASGRKLPKLPCHRLGKLIRFTEADFVAILELTSNPIPAGKLERFRII